MKTINCIEFKRETAQAVQEKLGSLSREQQLAYWENRYVEIMQRASTIRENNSAYGKK